MKRRTFLFTASLIFLTLLSFTTFSEGFVKEIYAWDDCPKGLVNDPYPGSCPRYIDTDGNGICDHSEPAPEDRVVNQDINKETTEKQTKSPITFASSKETENLFSNSVITLLSIFIPLTAFVGYASVYKIKQSKRL